MTLPPERPGTAPSPELLAWRGGLDAVVASGAFEVEPAPEAVSLGGISALRFEPPATSRATILHFHGGGFRLGLPEQVAPFAAALARRAQVTVVCPRYRLAPEHPFPAALRDARAALTALQASRAGPIVLSGDSAGGGIAAGLITISTDDPAPPVALILLSPWLDLTLTDPGFEDNAASDPLFSRAAAEVAAALYLQGMRADHPLVSPVLGPVGRFPPAFLNAGVGEVLVGDARRLHARLVGAGVPVQLQVVPDMEHVAVTRGSQLIGAAETFEAVLAFLDDVLRTGP